MFIRALGYLMILLACRAFGEQAAGRLKKHRGGLKFLQGWLSLFQGKLLFEGATMEEALQESAAQAESPFAAFFERTAAGLQEKTGLTFREIWEREAKDCLRDFPFTKEEYADFIRLGTTLGQMDPEVQKRAISVYAKNLENAIGAADEEIAVKGKLYQSLGVLAGCFIIILIW